MYVVEHAPALLLWSLGSNAVFLICEMKQTQICAPPPPPPPHTENLNQPFADGAISGHIRAEIQSLAMGAKRGPRARTHAHIHTRAVKTVGARTVSRLIGTCSDSPGGPPHAPRAPPRTRGPPRPPHPPHRPPSLLFPPSPRLGNSLNASSGNSPSPSHMHTRSRAHTHTHTHGRSYRRIPAERLPVNCRARTGPAR